MDQLKKELEEKLVLKDFEKCQRKLRNYWELFLYLSNFEGDTATETITHHFSHIAVKLKADDTKELLKFFVIKKILFWGATHGTRSKIYFTKLGILIL